MATTETLCAQYNQALTNNIIKVCNYIRNNEPNELKKFFNTLIKVDKLSVCYGSANTNVTQCIIFPCDYFYDFANYIPIQDVIRSKSSMIFYKIFEENYFNLHDNLYGIKNFIVKNIIRYGNSQLFYYLMNKNIIKDDDVLCRKYFNEVCEKGYLDILRFYIYKKYFQNLPKCVNKFVFGDACALSIENNNIDCFNMLFDHNHKVIITTDMWRAALANSNQYYIKKLLNCPYDYNTKHYFEIYTKYEKCYVEGNLLILAVMVGLTENFKILLDTIPTLDINYVKYIDSLSPLNPFITIKDRELCGVLSCISFALTNKDYEKLEIILQNPKIIIDNEIYDYMLRDQTIKNLINKYNITSTN